MHVETETLIMFASRREHIDKVILPALDKGFWVISDRFTDATYAYQGGGRGLPTHQIDAAAALVHPDLQPTLTILLDAPPAVGLSRARARSAADRFEAEQLSFFERVRQAYLDLARRQPLRFVVIDATQDLSGVHDTIRTRLNERLT